jgi:outer membrane biosynthesis protein TonB
MKTSTLLKSALSIALVSALIFSCKKKDDTAPEDTNTTTTTGGGTTGGTPTPTTPANGLSANQYKIGTTVYTVTTPGWQQTATQDTIHQHFQINLKPFFRAKAL